MPTYTDNSTGEAKQFYQYIDDDRYTFSDHTPYYNPIIDEYTLSGTDTTEEHSVDVFNTSSIRIVYISGDVTIYLNSTANAPGMTIKENVTLRNNQRITRIYATFTGAGEILVQENE